MVRHRVLCLIESRVVNSTCVVQDGKGEISLMEASRAVDVFAVDESIALVEHLIGLSWPIRLDQFDSTAQQLGWSPTGNTGIFTGNFASGEGYITLTKDEDGNISVISLPFFKPGRKGFEEAGLINDAFVAYVAAGVEAWGKPFDIVIDKRSHVAWKYPQNVIVELSRSDLSARLRFYTPQGIRVY